MWHVSVILDDLGLLEFTNMKSYFNFMMVTCLL